MKLTKSDRTEDGFVGRRGKVFLDRINRVIFSIYYLS